MAINHPWKLTPQQAYRLQKTLRRKLKFYPIGDDQIKKVGGLDASYTDNVIHGVVAVVDYASQQLIDCAQATLPVNFPYIGGLLSFRESPVYIEALMKLKSLPDVLIVDGHGIAHPRRFGIACHLGLIMGIPTIGCAKSILVGNQGDLTLEMGSRAYLFDERQDILGMAVRTRAGVKPVYVSSGHLIDLESAGRIILRCCRGFRLPEPVRMAHKMAALRNYTN